MSNNVMCTIENHATLFGLMSKYANELAGEDGKLAVLKAVTKYGNERGQRMATSAKNNGDEINTLTNQAYGEWKPDYDGQMTFGIIHGEPTLQTFISKCAWCDAWKKHDLLEYGKLYCVDVDNAVYLGYQDKYKCDELGEPMSWGGDVCRFDWGGSLSQDELELLANKKKENGSKFMKDMNFHTAHILNTVGDTIKEELGDVGEKAVSKAIEDYKEIFGEEYFNVLLSYDKSVF
ncbi:MAG: L-2-amino-thiazoline-4-carboxylic acid hydrolase [Lachnospiraceae bacterium]|jgi:hypothetical protein|nr:L-2-amino-thiazoline-4-carboxylic acid hydrolase [Lachnospiraceae bacterium]